MLNEMAVFAEVVDCGSFSAAARKTGITTSAVSRHVGRLEAHLGGRLLLRSTRALSLTELGEQVYAACTAMLGHAREVGAMGGAYRAAPGGRLRVSAPVVFGQAWLAPRLPGFLRQAPGVDLQLTLVDRPVDLVQDGVDVAIRIAATLAPGLASRPLCRFPYIVVAAPAYLAAHGAPATPAQLADHDCLYLGYGSFGAACTFTDGSVHQAVTLRSRMTINNSEALVACALAGDALALVPAFAADAALRAGLLVQLLPAWEAGAPYTAMAHMVYTPGRHIPLKIRAFIDYLVDAAAPRPQ